MAPYTHGRAAGEVRRLSGGPLAAVLRQPNGPVYLPSRDRLLFSDSENKSVSFYSMDARTGAATAVWTGSSYGGMALDLYSGELVACDHTARAVVRLRGATMDRPVKVVTLASHYAAPAAHANAQAPSP